MPRVVTPESLVSLDHAVRMHHDRASLRRKFEEEARAEVDRKMATQDKAVANAVMALSGKVSRARLIREFGIGYATLDKWLAMADEVPTSTSANAPAIASDRPQFAILDGLLHVSTEEHSAEAVMQFWDDGTRNFDVVTSEWSPDWQVHNKLVPALADHDSPLHAEAVAFVEEWEKDK